MTVWADGDSLQAELRGLLCRRAASRSDPGFRVVFVSARPLALPEGIGKIVVEPGRDAADDRIAESASAGDLAVTRDLVLAERLAEAGLVVLNDRGDVFTAGDARERRSLRDRAAELRAAGLAPELSRRRTWGRTELKKFADAFDRELTRSLARAREP
ncbi:MAG: DUF188 domain-containing protein [Treponema sp.]|nr:DUF188 domain-containing protein [Treponema sp.]